MLSNAASYFLGVNMPVVSLPLLSKRAYTSLKGEGFKEFLEPKIEVQAKRFEHHPLLSEWLGRSSLSPMKILALIAPLMIEFVMGFRDYNRFYLRYPSNKTDTIFEHVINTHTIEDEKHSSLFLSDWKELGLDAMLGWQCSDYMSSVMSTYDHRMKSQGLKLYFLAHENPHPFARFALMETIETAGQKFFRGTVGYGNILAESTGGAFNYFGPHHLALETGHMENEDVFFSSNYTYLKQATLLTSKYGVNFEEISFRNNVECIVSQVGDIFVDTFDAWYECAQCFSKDRDFFRKVYSSNSKIKLSYPEASETNRHHLYSFFSQSQNLRIQSNLKKIHDHALYSNLSSFCQTVRALTPFALIDILGTAFICRFNNWAYCGSSGKDLPTLINLSKAIGGMGDALIHDWKHLNLDDYGVGFDASQIMLFKFFAQRSDLHREHFARWFSLLLEHKGPRMRCFIIHMTITLYAAFIEAFAPCLVHATQPHALTLFNGKWFHKYDHYARPVIRALENELTAEERKELATTMSDISDRFLCQLNQAVEAIKESDHIEMRCLPTMSSAFK